MNARPTYNKIIVRPLEEKETVRGGIIIPVTVERQQTLVGIVEAVGPGRVNDHGNLIPCCVNVGDKILYSRHQGFPVEIDKVMYTAMPDQEALIIFPKDEPQAS